MDDAKQNLLAQVDALHDSAAELRAACDRAIAIIDAAEAKRAAAHKDTMAALDAMFDYIDTISGKKKAAKESPAGIAFIEGVGIREVKP